jgi:hypothetical protein
MPKVTGRTTVPSGYAALPGIMPLKGDLLGTSMSVKYRPIFLKVLAKMRFRPLSPSMSTLVSLISATTGFRTRENLPSSEKLVH